jgi:hypothetical protein
MLSEAAEATFPVRGSWPCLQDVGEEAEETGSAEDDAVGGSSTSVGWDGSSGDGSVGAISGDRAGGSHGGVDGGRSASTAGRSSGAAVDGGSRLRGSGSSWGALSSCSLG